MTPRRTALLVDLSGLSGAGDRKGPLNVLRQHGAESLCIAREGALLIPEQRQRLAQRLPLVGQTGNS